MERMLGWDDDLRPTLAQTLIEKVATFGVKPASFWYDIVLDPSKYAGMANEDTEDEGSALSEFDPSWRPTEAAEQEFSR